MGTPIFSGWVAQGASPAGPAPRPGPWATRWGQSSLPRELASGSYWDVCSAPLAGSPPCTAGAVSSRLGPARVSSHTLGSIHSCSGALA